MMDWDQIPKHPRSIPKSTSFFISLDILPPLLFVYKKSDLFFLEPEEKKSVGRSGSDVNKKIIFI